MHLIVPQGKGLGLGLQPRALAGTYRAQGSVLRQSWWHLALLPLWHVWSCGHMDSLATDEGAALARATEPAAAAAAAAAGPTKRQPEHCRALGADPAAPVPAQHHCPLPSWGAMGSKLGCLAAAHAPSAASVHIGMRRWWPAGL